MSHKQMGRFFKLIFGIIIVNSVAFLLPPSVVSGSLLMALGGYLLWDILED